MNYAQNYHLLLVTNTITMEIKKQDLELAIYGEITNEITRNNDDIINAKIQVGTGEVYSYLNRFDTDTMFSIDFEDDLLKQLCVNVIAWHLISLCSPNINIEMIRTNYDDAIEFLEKVQKGTVRPKWPLRADDPETPMDEAGNIQWSSNKKRNNHY